MNRICHSLFFIFYSSFFIKTPLLLVALSLTLSVHAQTINSYDFFGEFCVGEGLVTDASQLQTNHLEPTEGSLAALLDANCSTYFHSLWSQDNPDGGYAYLQADLKTSLSKLSIAYAKRSVNNNGNPVDIHVFATNNPAGTWSDQGNITCTYDYPTTVGSSKIANYAGIAYINLKAPYRYIRLQVESTEGGGVSRGNLYFYWSEFRVFNENAGDGDVSTDIRRLRITEIQPANVDMFMGPTYNYDGWIELYNPTDTTILLRNGFISRSPSQPKQCPLPWSLRIKPHAYGIIWMGEHEDKAVGQAQMKLDCDGGTVCLADANGVVRLSADYPAAVTRTSWALRDLDADEWGYTSTPTPGAANAGSTFATDILDAPVVDAPSQCYTGRLRAKVTIPSGCTLRFTTDGTTPTLTNGTISRDGLFVLSDKTAIYRFRLFAPGRLPSPVVTRSFLCTDRQYTVPVLSVVTDPDHLYDDEIGVMVRGTNGVTGRGQSSPCNWNRDWDRPVNFEYILPDGSVVENREATLIICGGWSRANTPHSFKLKANKIYYGLNSLDYAYFSAKPFLKNKTIQLRSGGNDNGCRLMDAALQTIIQSSGLDVDGLSYQPVVHYLNGQYNGVINVREPNNKHYVYANRGWDDDEIDQFEIATARYNQVCGTKDALNELRELSKNCAVDEVYDEVCRRLDIDEYCNYIATEIYLGTSDWLNNNNNCKGYRRRIEDLDTSEPIDSADGRFRLVQFDLDSAFGTVDGFNYFSQTRTLLNHVTGRDEEFDLINIFYYLCRNPRFRKRFADTFCLVAGSVFEPDRCRAIVDSLTANVSPMLALEGLSSTGTANSIKSNLTASRQSTMVGRMRSFSLLKQSAVPAQHVSLDANIDGARLFVDDLHVPTDRFSGILCSPITLRAEAPAGYHFIGWKQMSAGLTRTLLGKGRPWRYYDGGSLDGIDWTSASYDLKDWKTGAAPLGYAGKDLGIHTNVSYGPNSADKYPTCYFRTYATLPEGVVGRITLDYLCDDGFVIYVNGKEAGRYNMPGGRPSFSTYSVTYSSDGDQGQLSLDPRLFHTGSNVICVEVHNCSANSSDLLWDASLTAFLAADDEASTLSTEPTVALPATGDFDLVACFEPDATGGAEPLVPIRINEVSAANDTYCSDYRKRSDWLELYNATSRPIDLAGLYLSDDPDEPLKYRIPAFTDVTPVTENPLYGGLRTASTLIEPHGYRVVWCDKLEPLTQLHADFKLSSDSAIVLLTAADQSWADTLAYIPHDAGHTVGRYPDGTGATWLLSRPTIGAANQLSSYSLVYDERSARDILTALLPLPDDAPNGADATPGDATTLYDLYGRRVLHPVPGTIYIQGGQKILY